MWVVAVAEALKDSARVMVKTLVEMESSYLSANIFRHIMELQSRAMTSDEARIALKEFRTLSGGGLTRQELMHGGQKGLSFFIIYLAVVFLFKSISCTLVHGALFCDCRLWRHLIYHRTKYAVYTKCVCL